MDDLEVLRSIPPFRVLAPRDARRLLQGAVRRTWFPGTRIVRKGEPGEAMYVVLSGRVEVPVTREDGRVRFLAYLKAGDVFGEMALLTGEPRTADVVASGTEPTTCLELRRDALQPILAAHPAVAAVLTEIVGRRLLEDNALRRVGKYVILREIGRGAMATVFEGYHPDLQRGVAVKMLAHGMVYRSDFAERFRREARVLASLRHEGIVEVYDAEQAYGTFFLVMEKLEGIDLERWAPADGGVPPDEVRRILIEVARALGYAHERGVIHRDVKPSNVFRLPDGRLRLVDFGIATGPVNSGDEEEILCSPAYVAPEVVEGKPVDGRTDLYSLGILAFRLLTGRLPFVGTDPATLFDAHRNRPFPDVAQEAPGLPPDLAAFVRATTAKRPGDRPADARAALALLAAAPPAMRGLALVVRHPPEAEGRVRDALAQAARAVREVPGTTAEIAPAGDGPRETAPPTP